MAKARAIAERRKAVNNIKKITRTMQLIATARYQQSLQKATASRPYTQHVTELVQRVSEAGGTLDHPLLKRNTESKRYALLLLTSNRGLCGGYNANLLRGAVATADENSKQDCETDMYVVGKKGVNYFKFMRRSMTKTYADLPDAPSFADVEPIAHTFMDRYTCGAYAGVQVVYMKFLTAARQEVDCLRLLPTEKEPALDTGSGAEKSAQAKEALQYEFSPEPARLLAELLPVTVKIRLFQCFLDAAVSENVARMVAMKSATDAATEMNKLLTQQYNRARQTQITMELLDIMGGVEALK